MVLSLQWQRSWRCLEKYAFAQRCGGTTVFVATGIGDCGCMAWELATCMARVRGHHIFAPPWATVKILWVSTECTVITVGGWRHASSSASSPHHQLQRDTHKCRHASDARHSGAGPGAFAGIMVLSPCAPLLGGARHRDAPCIESNPVRCVQRSVELFTQLRMRHIIIVLGTAVQLRSKPLWRKQ